MAGSDTDSFLTAEPAIVVDENIDDEFIEASMRGTSPNMENSHLSTILSPRRSPYDEVTRGSEHTAVVSNEAMLLSPSSFSASDLARSQQNANGSRKTLSISTHDISQNGRSSTDAQNDALPPLPHDNLGRTQHGVTVRRAVNKCRRMSMVNSAKFKSARSMEHVNLDDRSLVSPFERSMSSRNMDSSSLNGSSNPRLSPSPERRNRGGFDSPQIMRVDSGHYT